MTVTYTNNFNFPMLDDGGENAGAVNNGVYVDIDRLIYQLRHPVISLISKKPMISRITGQQLFYYQPTI